MKKYIKYFSLLLLFVILSTTKVEAAKVTCDTLKISKTYHYNLDKKGHSESIKVSISKKKNGYYHDYTVNVKINGKTAIKKTSKEQFSNPFIVMVTDTNKKDKQLELLVVEEYAYQSISHIYYYQYKDGTAVYQQDLAELFKQNMQNVSELHRMKDKSSLAVNGKGEIYAKLCISVENFDYQHIKIKLKLKNGIFERDSSKNYKTLDEKKLLWFVKPRKAITAYTKRGGTKKAYSITKKSKDVKIVGIYHNPENGETYLKVKNGKGKVGWVDVEKASTNFGSTYHVG